MKQASGTRKWLLFAPWTESPPGATPAVTAHRARAFDGAGVHIQSSTLSGFGDPARGD